MNTNKRYYFKWHTQIFVLLILSLLSFSCNLVPEPPRVETNVGNNLESVSQLGGECTAVYAQGKYAYIGEGSNLVILDVSSISSPKKIGNVLLPGSIKKLCVFGNYAYCACNEKGFHIADLTDPAKPTLISSMSNFKNAIDVQVLGNIAYIADGKDGARIVDITIPSKPVLINTYKELHYAAGLYILGKYLYVLDGTSKKEEYDYDIEKNGPYKKSKLLIIDITNLKNPNLVSSYNYINGFNDDICVYGNTAFILNPANDCLYSIDINNPNNPVLRSSFNTKQSQASVISEKGDILYSIGCDNFETINISNPDKMLSRNISNLKEVSKDIFVLGNLVYIANGRDGLKIYDVSNAAHPILKGFYRTIPSFIYEIAISGNIAYTIGLKDGFQIIDISNPSKPFTVTNYDRKELKDVSGGMCISGNSLYICGSKGLNIFDITNRLKPMLLGSVKNKDDFGYGSCLYVAGNYLYATGIRNGFAIFDVSNPSKPSLVSEYKTYDCYGRVFVAGDLLYLPSGSKKLDIYDISKPGQPVLKKTFKTSVMAKNACAAGDKAYISDGGGYFEIIDISNSLAPKHISTYKSNKFKRFWNSAYITSSGMCISYIESVSDIYVIKNKIYFLGSGIQIVDVSDPSNPKSLASYIPYYPKRIVISGNYIYVADPFTGLQILRYTGETYNSNK